MASTHPSNSNDAGDKDDIGMTEAPEETDVADSDGGDSPSNDGLQSTLEADVLGVAAFGEHETLARLLKVDVVGCGWYGLCCAHLALVAAG